MRTRAPIPRLKRKYEVDESYWLVRGFRHFVRQVPPALRIIALTVKWRRVPRPWELSFIDRMRELLRAGLTFDEILSAALPQLFGEDTSHVFRSWIGRKARQNPERFVRSVSGMFGASARSVIVSIDKLTDEANMFERKAPQEPPYQSLLEAIRKSDEAMMLAQRLESAEGP
jgi:hypothetical protein